MLSLKGFIMILILMIQYDIIACSKGKRKINDLKSENDDKGTFLSFLCFSFLTIKKILNVVV